MKLRSLFPHLSLRAVEGSGHGPYFQYSMAQKLKGCCKVSGKDHRIVTLSAPLWGSPELSVRGKDWE